MSEMIDHGENVQKSQACPVIGSQSATACLPVAISPYAVAGPAKIKCCGEPEIIANCNHCRGRKNGICEFIISQKMRVDIPVEFGASVNVGDTYVNFDCAKGEIVDGKCDRPKHQED